MDATGGADMNRDKFKDRRGDEYSFVYYNSGEVDVRKKKKNGSVFQVSYSDEAVDRLKDFLNGIKVKRE